MISHNLKVALRNLMKYKLQTTISVLSIAIGIVTLAFAHAMVSRITFPSIYRQSYYERSFAVSLTQIGDSVPIGDTKDRNKPAPCFTRDVLLALKRDGGPRSIERMAVPNGTWFGDIMEFRLGDSIRRKTFIPFTLVEPSYFNLVGIRSAITGRTISKLKPGEAIISQKMAAIVFGNDDPRGAAVCQRGYRMLTIPLTIVDVFEDVSCFDPLLNSQSLYICLGEMESELFGAKNGEGGEPYYARWVTIVLREGSTTSHLLHELNVRLKPFGFRATLESAVNRDDISIVVAVQTLIHLAGALILIAALIGFLRM